MISTTPRRRTSSRAGGSLSTPLVSLGIRLLWLRSRSESLLSLLPCADINPISRLLGVDSESPGRIRGIVLGCSHPTCLLGAVIARSGDRCRVKPRILPRRCTGGGNPPIDRGPTLVQLLTVSLIGLEPAVALMFSAN